MTDESSFDELPELMLSLRSMGSRRGLPNEGRALPEEQDRFFLPLLEGRRTAARAVSRPQAVAAFDARRLTALVDATIRAFASERCGGRAPARRAFEAELFEIVEPLRDALQQLAARAQAFPVGQQTAVPDEHWMLWIDQLRVVFHVADASWPPLHEALANAPSTPPVARRWPFLSRGDHSR